MTRLQKHLEAGTIWVDKVSEAYMGYDRDGHEVNLGWTGDPESCEAYLRDFPNPSDW